MKSLVLLTTLRSLFGSFIAAVLFILVVTCSGCNYYKATYPQAGDAATKEEFNQLFATNKYFIIHSDTQYYHLINPFYDFTQKVVTGKIAQVDSVHYVHLDNKAADKTPRYKKKSADTLVLQEVHLYLSQPMQLSNEGEVTIPFGNISKVEVLEKDRQRTTASYTFTTGATIVGTIAIIAGIVAATKSSCPFVYVEENSQYHFVGEIYGGAIFPQLERDDIIPLQSGTIHPAHTVRITNELKEKQYTNLAELWVVEHEQGLTAYSDQYGNVNLTGTVILPISARLNNMDQSALLKGTSDGSCLFNDEGNLVQHLELTFQREVIRENGLLILNLRNSLWLDYIYGEFSSLFGSSYNKWKEKQKLLDADSLQSWSNHQGIPMQVSILTHNGWKPVATIESIGPLAFRDIGIPIKLSEVDGNRVDIRLSCGFLFWEVDYAAWCNDPQKDFTLYKIRPFSAVTEQSKDVTGQLSYTDDQYLDQPPQEGITEVNYELPPLDERKSFSVFLHARGHYEHIRDYNGVPNVITLLSLRKPLSFTQFSMDRYFEMYPMRALTASQ